MNKIIFRIKEAAAQAEKTHAVMSITPQSITIRMKNGCINMMDNVHRYLTWIKQ